MNKYSGLFTVDGKEILSTEYVESLREKEAKKKVTKTFIAQKGGQEIDLHTNVDILVTGGGRGGGKANSKNTLVVTPIGYRKLGDLNVGDEICTPYNGIQKVNAIYEQGVNTVYAFHFDDGTSVTVMDNHRFLARDGSQGHFTEMTAREIMDNYKLNAPYPLSLRQGHHQLMEIPLCGEVEMNEHITTIDLPIHPFLLGVASAKGTIEFAQQGLVVTGSHYDLLCARNLGYISKAARKNRMRYYLKGFTYEQRRMITTKRVPIDSFIPAQYMTASIEARWSYVQGAWRGNGRSRHKHPYMESWNKPYLMQLADMVRSLGCWAKVMEVQDDPDKAGWWCLCVKAPSDKDVHSNRRYKELAHINAPKPTSPKCKDMLSKKILRIVKLDTKADCRCITVSGRDHLYMTEHYTVNHNTVTMLTKPMYDFGNKHFNGIIFRKNKDDFENIVNESIRWFAPLGKYNKSKDDMTWNMYSGAKLKLSTYDMSLADFDIKYRGQQFAYIGIDELPQMPFEYFKFIMTCCRNTLGIRSHILGTCNPDPLSWLRIFLDWWIGKEDTVYSDGKRHPELKGFIIPERDAVIRYCYMPDNNVSNIVWGDSPDEVYEQCKDVIDAAWNESLRELGYDKKTFAVKSVAFVKASLYDNKALLKTDPSYIANLLNQPLEIRMREHDGNWDEILIGEDMILSSHFDRIFKNAQMLGDGVRRASCDVAGTGGDNCVLWKWIGWHVADVFVCRRDPYSTVDIIREKLIEWGVLEENFTYDLNGMGQVLKGAFPRAVPFNNQEAVPEKFRFMYDNIKSMSAYLFAQKSIQLEWSIEPSLLSRKFKVGNVVMDLYHILQNERKAIKQDMSRADRGWCLIHKEQMKNKALVGHSPDFIEALFERMIFEIKRTQVVIPSWVNKTRITTGPNRIFKRKLGIKRINR